MFNFKIYLGIIGLLIVAILGLLALNHSRAGTIEDLRKELAAAVAQGQIYAANLSECNAKIDLQNERVKEMALQNEKLKAAEPIIKKEIEKRYKRIGAPTKDAKCEKKLKFYEEIFREMGR
ncbi:hypothetical protein [uncultured Campylobacter sp.]|uniref:hypothetical protein n=1 Tax=uncultured Campylobacter sp. TaxID=218934 RepID=UPI002634F9F7|nr:hypothetical protein [uncultured Campylobacter sp.]